MQLIPKPQKYSQTSSLCKITSFSTYHIDKELCACSDLILSILQKGLKKELKNKKGEIDILFDKFIKKEGYMLSAKENNITITASDFVGVLYAVESLRILAEFDVELKDFPCCEIDDYPKFEWRGLIIDESRHFFGKEFIKNLLDVMALHKLNVMHWHLTDDVGWRIEIKKYPKLVEVGSKREQSQINGWKSGMGDGIPYEGSYTQEEIKEIINYASSRGIMIVPEIDMPGHFLAAIAAYPELACRNLDRPVPWFLGDKYPSTHGMPDWNRPLCVSNENTMNVVHDILDEVFALFPAPYFHIGGDEVDMREWKTCPKCQARMQEKGYKDVKQLQCEFINGIQKYAKERGKRLVGWNECLKGDALDSSVLVQYWTPQTDNKVNEHIIKGGEVIISKHQFFYFNMTYAQYPLKNTYDFSLVKCNVPRGLEDNVKGVEGALWAEWIPNKEKFELQAFPRIEALSEVSWNQSEKNYEEFLGRLDSFNKILKALNINYAESAIHSPKRLFKKLYIMKKWFKGNTDLELNENKELKNNE